MARRRARAGTRLKLTINLWIMNLVENLAETFALAEANGLDPRLVPGRDQGPADGLAATRT